MSCCFSLFEGQLRPRHQITSARGDRSQEAGLALQQVLEQRPERHDTVLFLPALFLIARNLRIDKAAPS